MKKALLLAAITAAAVSVSAKDQQVASANMSSVSSQQQFQLQAPYTVLPARQAAIGRYMGEQVAVKNAKIQKAQPKRAFQHVELKQQLTLKAGVSTLRNSAIRKAAPETLKESYVANGYAYNGQSKQFEATDSWTLYAATGTYADGTEVDLLVDVIPDLVGFGQAIPEYADGVYVEYTTDGNTLTIAPQYIAGTSQYDIFLVDLVSADAGGDGSIILNLDAEGNLTISEDAQLSYWACNAQGGDELPVFDYAKSAGYYEVIAGITYGENGGGSGDSDFDLIQAYTGKGKDQSSAATVSWDMAIGTYSGLDVVVNPCPSIFEDGSDLVVVATTEGNTITIEPQKVAEVGGGKYYLYIASLTSADGNLVLTRDATTGACSLPEGEGIVVGAFSTDAFDPSYGDSYAGYWQITNNVLYYAKDEEIPTVAPEVYAEVPGILFCGLSPSGYSYNANLAIIPAYTDINLKNCTVDDATAWAWNADQISYNAETQSYDVVNNFTSAERSFVLPTENGVYNNISLVGINGEKASDPYVVGMGSDYESFYAYAGSAQSTFQMSDGTYSILSRHNPANDLAFYTNWGTPDIYTSMSVANIYIYGDKPAAPLYITGVTLPLVSFANHGDFTLTCKIAKAEVSSAGRITIGDVIAQCDATDESIDDSYSSGLALINFDQFYVEDEDGMSEYIDHLFIEDSYVIILEGWDNGTFSGVIGAEDNPNALATKSTFFEKTGEPGAYYAYTSWLTKLFVGFEGAAYGYLHTEADASNVVIPAEGGTASFVIEPMLCGITEDGTYTTNVGIEENTEIPEWLEVGIVSEEYSDNAWQFELGITAEALPAGVEGRTATFRLYQTGAYLDVTVNQGAVAGIKAVTVSAVKGDGKTYNFAGQQVGKEYKGIVICNGQKTVQ